ncbi:MAG: ScpA family protein [bacterium]
MEQEVGFKIKVSDFEGPLDILLSLIEKRKLCINDIALSEITDAYIEYLEKFEEFPLTEGTDFIIIASTLILIKSISLLPGVSLTQEEKESVEELESRLKAYKDIKEKSIFIKDNLGKKIIFFGGLKKKNQQIFLPTHEINLSNLLSSIKEVINNVPTKEKLPEIKVKKVISLEEAIENLSTRIQSGLKMNFSEFAKKKGLNSQDEIKNDKINVVVNFLAMLELVKRGMIRVTQNEHFSEISLEQGEARVPRYGEN